jgi:hypothetical protein
MRMRRKMRRIRVFHTILNNSIGLVCGTIYRKKNICGVQCNVNRSISLVFQTFITQVLLQYISQVLSYKSLHLANIVYLCVSHESYCLIYILVDGLARGWK